MRGSQQTYQKPAAEDAAFIASSISSSMFVQKISEMALERDIDDELRDFSERMINRHVRVDDGLRTIGRRKWMDIPVSLGSDASGMVSDLDGLQGQGFVERFLQHHVDSHQRLVDLLEVARTAAKDPDIRGFAERYMPDLQSCLDTARQVSRSYTSLV